MIQEPKIEVDDVQGNVVPGFKKDYQNFLFFRISDPVQARQFIGRMARRVTTARQVLMAHALWKGMRATLGREPTDLRVLFLNLALTHSGLTSLSFGQGLDEFDDDGFAAGLAARAGLIGDPVAAEPGSPEQWLFGSPQSPVDLLLILASDDETWLAKETDSIVADAGGVALVHIDHGRVRRGDEAGHEVFGFKDGVSEPAIRGKYPDKNEYIVERTMPTGDAFASLRNKFAAPGRDLIWPGHFIFGYRQQDENAPEKSIPGPQAPKWARNGSFLVYRRLRQDVNGFEQFVKATSNELSTKNSSATPEWVGSRMIGRWKNGTPIIREPATDTLISVPANNYFTFSQAQTLVLPGDTAPLNPSDPQGDICPFAAHIRKVNPRDDTTDLGGASRTLQRLLLRRGIAYDNNVSAVGDEGLLFVAYQTSIVRQFEFLMGNWVNQADRPHASSGFDPILGAQAGRYLNISVNDEEMRVEIPQRFIFATGGAYLFSPSISCLALIAGVGAN